MRNPMIDCMAKEWIEEFMFNGNEFTVEDIMDALPLDHFDLTEDEKDAVNIYISDLADYMAEIYDYTLNEDASYTPNWDEDDNECICEDCRKKLKCHDEDEDEADDNIVYNTAVDKGLLTIPAKFVREIADSGEELAYATFGDRVEVFPTSNKKKMKAVKKDSDLINVYTYSPHYTHGYFEVRRTMNNLITDLEDASGVEFEIELDRDEDKIIVREA